MSSAAVQAQLDDSVDAAAAIAYDAAVADDAAMTFGDVDAGAAWAPIEVVTPPLEPPASTSVPAVPEPAVIDVTVRADSVAKRMQHSAESVQVVDLTRDRRQSADLGELLARSGGLGIRRSGGLGSAQQLVLGGFQGDQVRVFVDGIPIEFSGLGTTLINLPTALLQRVELYRGVVPVRFGTSALGGAVNVITRAPTRGLGGYSSLQLGSWGTVRTAAGSHYLHAPSGFLARVNGYYDYAKNDYPVQVELGNLAGGSSLQTVYRKHDAYRAGGAGVDVGFVRRKWAERLVLRMFAGAYAKQLQSDLVMSTAYGAVHYGGQQYQANLEYVQNFFDDKLRVEWLGGYGHQQLNFVDVGNYQYDWYGRQAHKLPIPGEISQGLRAWPSGQSDTNQHITENSGYGRFQFVWKLTPEQSLRLSISPTYTARTGVDRVVVGSSLDPLQADRRLLTEINGLEHTLKLWDERVENIAFVKQYIYHVSAREPLESGYWRDRSAQLQRFGVGDGLRVDTVSWAYVKLGYEYATRLPQAAEVFGNGGTIEANLSLRPEVSHNLNYGVVLHDLTSLLGTFALELQGSERRAHQLMALLGNNILSSYQNVYDAHGRGVEVLGSWLLPKGYLSFDGNVTYQSLRNDSSKGAFATFRGDRIPNRPYLFANASGRAMLPRPFSDDDELSLSYYLRYTHAFYRSWQRGGHAGVKPTVDTQFSHTLVLAYLIKQAERTWAFTMEAQNLTNARLFDNFGSQKPGRSYYAKVGYDF